MIDRAVILAAGLGSRLKAEVPKPLAKVGGTPLMMHTLLALQGRVKTVTVVVGFRGNEIATFLRANPVEDLAIRTVMNHRWEEPNGVSVIFARDSITERSLLLMGDHLFEPTVLDKLVDLPADQPDTILMVDRNIGRTFDLDDATKVRLDGDKIVEIGKQLEEYDAIDTGIFLVSPDLVTSLEACESPSLSQGMQALTSLGLARSIDIGDGWWQDVDDAAMFAHAEALLAQNQGGR